MSAEVRVPRRALGSASSREQIASSDQKTVVIEIASFSVSRATRRANSTLEIWRWASASGFITPSLSARAPFTESILNCSRAV